MEEYIKRRDALIQTENKYKLDYHEQCRVPNHDDYSKAVEIVNAVRRDEWADIWEAAEHTEVGAPFLNSKIHRALPLPSRVLMSACQPNTSSRERSCLSW